MFVEWTKPKLNALAAATNFRRLEQGDLSLAEYIDKATILCDQGEYPPEARDRLLRDAIVIGLRSKEAYYKCIEKSAALTLEEAIEIAQNQDTTGHQVGYMRPEFKDGPLQMEVHKLKGNRQLGAKWKRQQPQIPVSNDQPHMTDFNDQKQKEKREERKKRKLFQLWSETITSQKLVSRKEGKVLQVREGRALRFRVQTKEERCTCQ